MIPGDYDRPKSTPLPGHAAGCTVWVVVSSGYEVCTEGSVRVYPRPSLSYCVTRNFISYVILTSKVGKLVTITIGSVEYSLLGLCQAVHKLQVIESSGITVLHKCRLLKNMWMYEFDLTASKGGICALSTVAVFVK